MLGNTSIFFTFGIALVIIIIVMLFFSFIPVGLWITAYFSGVKIKISTLIGMRLRRVNPSRIVNPLIKATKAGLEIDINELEAHYLAGGNVNAVVDALIASPEGQYTLVFERAAAIDLAGECIRSRSSICKSKGYRDTPDFSSC